MVKVVGNSVAASFHGHECVATLQQTSLTVTDTGNCLTPPHHHQSYLQFTSLSPAKFHNKVTAQY